MRKKWSISLKAFILLLDNIIIAGAILFILWKLGVPVPLWAYILTVVICALVYWLLYRILLDQSKKSPVGCDNMIGLRCKAITPLNPEGQVRVQGEIWKAESKYGFIAEGVEVVIEDLKDLRLIVKIQTEHNNAELI